MREERRVERISNLITSYSQALYVILFNVHNKLILLMRKTEESVVTQLVSGGVPTCLTPKSKLFPYNLPAPITP